MKSLMLFLLITIVSASLKGQKSNIDPRWDNYYKEHPSRVYDHYNGTDFIVIIDAVGFIPSGNLFEKNVSLLKRILLAASKDELEMLSSEGWYYSRTFKHDDFFYLYNITYKKVTKDIWDLYCPYLIPLMNLDGTIDLK